MEISCPVSAERINENVVRVIAGFVMLIGIYSCLYINFYAVIFLTIDFGIRSFTSGKWSFLKFLALNITKTLSIENKSTDLAPKKFAATLGFAFCLMIGVFYLFNLVVIALALTIILIIFAFLESVFAVCVGCYVYSFWQGLFKKSN